MFVLNVIGKGAAPKMFSELAHGTPAILSPDFAFDLPVADAGALAAARDLAQGAGLDINLVKTANRKKKLLAADMDSTIITVECMDELAEIAGLGPVIADTTARAMRGELDFQTAMLERIGLLKGIALSVLEQTYQERVRLNSGARSLLATMRAHGAHTMLVSGGFDFFTQRVAEAAGFHVHHGNTLLDDGVALTGDVKRPIQGGDTKRQLLEDAAAALGIDMEDTIAVGDGANDRAMVRRAGLGVAYHAKPILVETAAAIIAHNDLTALLYLQGYTDREIIEA
jgi:phosphoserine phosphatase